MARFESVVAGTGVIPIFGTPLIDEADLESIAAQYRGGTVPMLLDHDLDAPIDATVLSTEIRDGPEGDRQLVITFEVPDEQAQAIGDRIGMSIAFTRTLIAPDGEEPDVAVWIDPHHYHRSELEASVFRLRRAGFRPAGGVYPQLAEVPAATVVLDIAWKLLVELGVAVTAAALYDSLKGLVRAGDKTRFRFRLHMGTEGTLTAEIETSSERAFRDALKALGELSDTPSGAVIRVGKEWRRAGASRRRRRKASSRRRARR